MENFLFILPNRLVIKKYYRSHSTGPKLKHYSPYIIKRNNTGVLCFLFIVKRWPAKYIYHPFYTSEKQTSSVQVVFGSVPTFHKHAEELEMGCLRRKPLSLEEFHNRSTHDPVQLWGWKRYLIGNERHWFFCSFISAFRNNKWEVTATKYSKHKLLVFFLLHAIISFSSLFFFFCRKKERRVTCPTWHGWHQSWKQLGKEGELSPGMEVAVLTPWIGHWILHKPVAIKIHRIH